MGRWRIFPVTVLSSAIVLWWSIRTHLKKKKIFTIDQFLRAAAVGDLQLLAEILEEGKVPINRRNAEGTTPLMLAVANGHNECAELLLRYDADPAIRRVTAHTLCTLHVSQG